MILSELRWLRSTVNAHTSVVGLFHVFSVFHNFGHQGALREQILDSNLFTEEVTLPLEVGIYCLRGQLNFHCSAVSFGTW